eukprot:4893632-Amphidinium_carterae.1
MDDLRMRADGVSAEQPAQRNRRPQHRKADTRGVAGPSSWVRSSRACCGRLGKFGRRARGCPSRAPPSPYGSERPSQSCSEMRGRSTL